MVKRKRVTMRLSAIKGNEMDVQSFWVSDVRSPSEEKITRSSMDIERGERTLTRVCTETRRGSKAGRDAEKDEAVASEGIMKTVEFRMVDNAVQ